MSTVQPVSSLPGPRMVALRGDRRNAPQARGWPSAAGHTEAPGRDGFVALLAAFRASGGTAPGEVLGCLMQERQGGDAASLARLITTGQVFGFEWRASLWLPMFQFGADDLTPRTGPQRAREALPSWHSDWATAYWFAAPNRWLDGDRPADRMADDPAAVLLAAQALKSADGCGNAPNIRGARRHTGPGKRKTAPADSAMED